MELRFLVTDLPNENVSTLLREYRIRIRKNHSMRIGFQLTV